MIITVTWAEVTREMARTDARRGEQLAYLVAYYGIDPTDMVDDHPLLPWVQLSMDVRQKIDISWGEHR